MIEPVATQTGLSSAHDVAVDTIAEALQGLCYGQLEVHLHEGQVVKIMRTEKIRLFEASATNARRTNPG